MSTVRADIAWRISAWGWRRGAVGDSLFLDAFAFHGDGHENTKMTSNTNPLALNRSLCKPSGCIDAQGECGRVERSMSYRSLPFWGVKILGISWVSGDVAKIAHDVRILMLLGNPYSLNTCSWRMHWLDRSNLSLHPHLVAFLWRWISPCFHRVIFDWLVVSF